MITWNLIVAVLAAIVIISAPLGLFAGAAARVCIAVSSRSWSFRATIAKPSWSSGARRRPVCGA